MESGCLEEFGGDNEIPLPVLGGVFLQRLASMCSSSHCASLRAQLGMGTPIMCSMASLAALRMRKSPMKASSVVDCDCSRRWCRRYSVGLVILDGWFGAWNGGMCGMGTGIEHGVLRGGAMCQKLPWWPFTVR